MKIGFIGLGNVGGKLSASLLRNGYDLTVRDLDRSVAEPCLAAGAKWADSPKAMVEAVDMVITCLPSPAASADVMEADDGVLAGLGAGKIWAEMSTTDEAEVTRLGALVLERGGEPVDCPAHRSRVQSSVRRRSSVSPIPADRELIHSWNNPRPSFLSSP